MSFAKYKPVRKASMVIVHTTRSSPMSRVGVVQRSYYYEVSNPMSRVGVVQRSYYYEMSNPMSMIGID